jgi:hypothetical protein
MKKKEEENILIKTVITKNETADLSQAVMPLTCIMEVPSSNFG